MGTAQNNLGKTIEASKTFKSLTKQHPSHANSFNNLGVTLQAQGKLEDAIEAYNKALSLKPGFAETYYNLGNILKNRVNWTKLLKHIICRSRSILIIQKPIITRALL